jgi:hypothetical protein
MSADRAAWLLCGLAAFYNYSYLNDPRIERYGNYSNFAFRNCEQKEH